MQKATVMHTVGNLTNFGKLTNFVNFKIPKLDTQSVISMFHS